jgi:hypothetical protein
MSVGFATFLCLEGARNKFNSVERFKFGILAIYWSMLTDINTLTVLLGGVHHHGHASLLLHLHASLHLLHLLHVHLLLHHHPVLLLLGVHALGVGHLHHALHLLGVWLVDAHGVGRVKWLGLRILFALLFGAGSLVISLLLLFFLQHLFIVFPGPVHVLHVQLTDEIFRDIS